MRTLYFYFPQKVKDLELIVEAYQKEFDQKLEDAFSDDELLLLEKYIDYLGAVFVQPIISELTFDDFIHDESNRDIHHGLFSRCQSSICIENLPFFENNPFQVSYLLNLMDKFSEILIDPGENRALMLKGDYQVFLSRYKNADSYFAIPQVKEVKKDSLHAITPVDFLVRDIYMELDKDKEASTLSLSPKCQTLLSIMINERLHASEIFQKAKLSPKDFEDHLERLKFTLRKR